MENFQILWADDEIELLKPHVLFLEAKGYKIDTVKSGQDALERVRGRAYDLVFLDENMPGLSGLETLSRIKQEKPGIPVVMVTKSEEEHIMEDAIGSKIADYLIKPVNPNQLLLTLKKNLDHRRLQQEKSSTGYQQEFREIGIQINGRPGLSEWMEIYKKLTFWELELEKNTDQSLLEIFSFQKSEANTRFCDFVEDNYVDWLKGHSTETPLMSHTLFKNKISGLLREDSPLFLIVIDNLRYDQWKILQPVIEEYFSIKEEGIYLSILPTATQYARNAIFSGLLPSEMEKRFPKLWVGDEDEEGKNMHEEEFLNEQLKRLGKQVKSSYTKVTNVHWGKKLADNVHNLMQNPLNVIVYNFVDMLSHARTEMEVIRELADDESAYRSITQSWFHHSPLLEAMKLIAQKKGRVFLTTDHGTVHVKEPSKVIGDRNTNTNLRYKQGKNLNYERNDVFEIRNPADAFLPRTHVSTSYIFAKTNKFFAYPNNYHHYVNYYRNTFQHGGVSMEEMMVPFVYMQSK
jgi:CheY-like chemotaxis protein